MAKVIEIEDHRLGSELLFQGPSNEIRSYITQQVNDYVAMAQLHAPELANALTNHYQGIIKKETCGVIQRSKELLNVVWDEESVRYLNTLQQVRTASNTMRRWVMAHPATRTRYLNGGLSAWEGDYKDSRPNEGTGRDHYDYRRATNGVVIKEDEQYIRREYFEAGVDPKDILSTMKKLLIKQTWQFLDASLKSDDNSDYTSLTNGVM